MMKDMAQRVAEHSGIVEGPSGERVSVRFYPDGAIRISVTKAGGYESPSMG